MNLKLPGSVRSALAVNGADVGPVSTDSKGHMMIKSRCLAPIKATKKAPKSGLITRCPQPWT